MPQGVSNNRICCSAFARMIRCAVQTRLRHHRGKERVDLRRRSRTPSTLARSWVSAAVMQTDSVLSSFNLNDSWSAQPRSSSRASWRLGRGGRPFSPVNGAPLSSSRERQSPKRTPRGGGPYHRSCVGAGEGMRKSRHVGQRRVCSVTGRRVAIVAQIFPREIQPARGTSGQV
jgi:hypothetical protein